MVRCCIHSSGGFFHDSSSFKRFFLGSCCFVCVGVHEFCYSRCLSLCLRADPNSSLWFVCSNLSWFFWARYLSSSITLRRSLVLSCFLSFALLLLILLLWFLPSHNPLQMLLKLVVSESFHSAIVPSPVLWEVCQEGVSREYHHHRLPHRRVLLQYLGDHVPG